MKTSLEAHNRYIRLYVEWDRKVYGKNHRRIRPPTAYFSWHRFARKNGVDDQWARMLEPSYAHRNKRGTERLAREHGFLNEGESLWTGSLHYGFWSKEWARSGCN